MSDSISLSIKILLFGIVRLFILIELMLKFFGRKSIKPFPLPNLSISLILLFFSGYIIVIIIGKFTIINN